MVGTSPDAARPAALPTLRTFVIASVSEAIQFFAADWIALSL
jgi:hypothetical protein